MRKANVGASRLPSTGGAITRLAYARAKAAGLKVKALAAKAGLSCRHIEDPQLPFSVRDQIRFLNAAAVAFDDDLLGFHLAQRAELREIGLLFYVIASSESLAEALQRGARYSSIVNEGIMLRWIDRGDAGLSFHYVGVSRRLDRHQIEFWMTALVRMCRDLMGLRLQPSVLRLTHSRDRGGAEFAEFFGQDVEFGASADEILFSADVKHQPAVSADPYLNRLLVQYCEEALAHRSHSGGSFRLRVENVVVPLLPHGKARVGEVARRLGVSERTLARHLSMEGFSFSGLLDQLRFDLAKRYLAEDSLSISQIAWLLGYGEVAAFSHAFRRWTGTPPRDARLDIASVA